MTTNSNIDAGAGHGTASTPGNSGRTNQTSRKGRVMPLSERDQIARIIDPLTFQLTDALNNAEGEPPELRRKATEMRDVKLAAAHAKADAILALRSKAEASLGGEGFSSSSADSATRRPSDGCDTEAQSPAGGEGSAEESSEQVIAQPIETAPKDDDGDAWILASTSGKVWFQACWDPEDECWVTFNRYAEVGYGRRQPGWKFEPKFWLPIPAPAEARSVEAFSSGPDRVAMALYDGFTVGISRLPWGDCYDWAALVARDYSAGKPLPAPPKATPAEMIEACITDIKAGLCCPRVHGCEQNDGEFCLVRQAFARAGLIADPYAAQAEGEA